MRPVELPLLPRPFRYALVAIIVIAIFVGSVVLVPPGPPQPTPLRDKWLHFAAYAGLALALSYATGSTVASRSHGRVIAIFAVTVAYGVGIEAAQWFLPARHPSTLDMLANAVGALAVIPWAIAESRLDYVQVGWDS